jgi:glycine betaine/proline transport system substrate-binding protein
VRTNGVVRGRVAAIVLAAATVATSGSVALAQDAGPVRIAVNPWVGSEANAAVIAHILESQLGYDVELINIDENTVWQGFETGEVDAILEVWGHDADRALYIDDLGVAQDAGPMGVNGVIGWYVPGWMVEEYPDITDSENLNEYAELFRTSESGDKGQFLIGDPSFVTNDEALITNLGLDFQVVAAGSEPALIESFTQATEQRTPLIGYFYDPQWAHSQEPLLSAPLVKVNLPEWTEGCDAVPEEVACDYPAYPLWKAVRTEFAESGGAAYELISNFSWSNLDQNTVSAYISNEGLSAEEAAARWVEENPDKVAAWLPAA